MCTRRRSTPRPLASACHRAFAPVDQPLMMPSASTRLSFQDAVARVHTVDGPRSGSYPAPHFERTSAVHDMPSVMQAVEIFRFTLIGPGRRRDHPVRGTWRPGCSTSRIAAIAALWVARSCSALECLVASVCPRVGANRDSSQAPDRRPRSRGASRTLAACRNGAAADGYDSRRWYIAWSAREKPP
jgi:hypothetical protein